MGTHIMLHKVGDFNRETDDWKWIEDWLVRISAISEVATIEVMIGYPRARKVGIVRTKNDSTRVVETAEHIDKLIKLEQKEQHA